MNGHLIKIGNGGAVSFIHDDRLFAALAEIGTATIKRASTVEPAAAGGWEADMRPTTGEGGPVLGPFATRGAALAAEVEWLQANVFGGA